MVPRSMNIYRKPSRINRLVFRALNLSTLNERRDTADLKFSNGLIFGSIDAPKLLSRIGFRIPGKTRSQKPYHLEPSII